MASTSSQCISLERRPVSLVRRRVGMGRACSGRRARAAPDRARSLQLGGFSLKWLKHSHFRPLPEACAAEMQSSLAGRTQRRALSTYASSSRDFAACPATLVSLSTVSSFVTSENARKFSRDNVWETPFCTIADVASLLRADGTTWDARRAFVRHATSMLLPRSDLATAWRSRCGTTRRRWI